MIFVCHRETRQISISQISSSLHPYKHFISLPFLCNLDLHVSAIFEAGINKILVNIFPEWQDMGHSSIRNAVRYKIYPITNTIHISSGSAISSCQVVVRAWWVHQRHPLTLRRMDCGPHFISSQKTLYVSSNCSLVTFNWPAGMDTGGRIHEPTAKASCTLLLQ